MRATTVATLRRPFVLGDQRFSSPALVCLDQPQLGRGVGEGDFTQGALGVFIEDQRGDTGLGQGITQQVGLHEVAGLVEAFH